MSLRRRSIALTIVLLLAGCVSRAPPPPSTVIVTPTPDSAAVPPLAVIPVADTALKAGLKLEAAQPIDGVQAVRALNAFRISCPVMVRRTDASLLTSGTDWQPLCVEAASVAPTDAANFFRDRFDWVKVGTGEAFATGYYEPEIRGSRVRAPGFETPVYRLPPDLIRCTRPNGVEGRGRIDPTGQCVLYSDRAEIEDGALAGRGLEIGWVADPVELFFLHIQGSGRLLLPDGGVMRIGYDGQNGREYVAIGRLLRDRNLLPAGGASMKAIVDWIHAHPTEGRALMRENLSYIFFKELTGAGPLGAMNVPVTPRGTVATDPKFVPLGAPVFLDLDRNEADGLWVAQDTGGAIKGANRFDTFWGAGAGAEITAGGMSAKGSALVLLPKGTAARAQALR
ncbi:MAG TPA: murein transglycosylase A [Sphingomicrobium sp.]|nr:murein transglycosylase A [Sphingomicrobium sp.]